MSFPSSVRYYQGDPVLNPHTPWERPPLKNIFCIYGIDSKTEVSTFYENQANMIICQKVIDIVLWWLVLSFGTLAR